MDNDNSVVKLMKVLTESFKKQPFLGIIAFIATPVILVLIPLFRNDTTALIIVVIMMIVLVGIICMMFIISIKWLPPDPPFTTNGTVYVSSKSGKIPIHTFYGFREMESPYNAMPGRVINDKGPDGSKRDKEVFIYQQFNKDMSCIQNMWADPLNYSYINPVLLFREGEPNVLLVDYFSKTTPSDITIKPYHFRPFIVDDEVKGLVIRARKAAVVSITDKNGVITKTSPQKVNGAEPAFGVRIINGYFQHWNYVEVNQANTGFRLTDEFKDYLIRLDDINKWSLFDRDGNIYYKEANDNHINKRFKIIIGINLKFGFFARQGDHNVLISNSGVKGIVEIADIFFVKGADINDYQ